MRACLKTALLFPLAFISQAGNSEIHREDYKIQGPTTRSIEPSTSFETIPITRPKLRELTDPEKKALDEIEYFLKTYTENGAYNYGSIPRFLEGLVVDYDAVREEAKTMPEGYEKTLALEYAEKGQKQFLITKKLVINEIRRKGTEQITEFLESIGVDKKTEENTDSTNNLKLVTKEILLKFRANAEVLQEVIKKDQLPGTKVTYPEGITLALVKSVRERISSVPDGIKTTIPDTQIVNVR